MTAVNEKGWQEISNRAPLVGHGPPGLRRDAIDIIEHAIRAANPYRATLRTLQRKGNFLQVGSRRYNLEKINHIYVIGAGKASQPIALALEELLGEHIVDGVIAIKAGEPSQLKRIRAIHAGHPVPDENSAEAARQIQALCRKAGKNDIVFCAITGGSSALLVQPQPPITLADLQELYRLLLHSGASIRQINAVRKHVSCIKGGRLGLEVFPAELINLTVSDVIGDPLDYITDLTVPDSSTWEDAYDTLDAYNLWEHLPASVRTVIQEKSGGETPKSYSQSHHSFIIVHGDAAVHGASDRCTELGYHTEVMTLAMEGESRRKAIEMVALARQLVTQKPSHRKLALIAGGETTVTITNNAGASGGPNQEFALAAANEIKGDASLVAAAVDMDGTDGPTEAAGGLVDGSTHLRLAAHRLDIQQALEGHTSFDALDAAADLVFTGPTGTNVNDLMFVLVDQSDSTHFVDTGTHYPHTSNHAVGT